VPHGPLLPLSFAALEDEHGGYLIENYVLHYAPSVSVLEFTGGKKHLHETTQSFLFVANPELSAGLRKENLPPLPVIHAA